MEQQFQQAQQAQFQKDMHARFVAEARAAGSSPRADAAPYTTAAAAAAAAVATTAAAAGRLSPREGALGAREGAHMGGLGRPTAALPPPQRPAALPASALPTIPVGVGGLHLKSEFGERAVRPLLIARGSPRSGVGGGAEEHAPLHPSLMMLAMRRHPHPGHELGDERPPKLQRAGGVTPRAQLVPPPP